MQFSAENSKRFFSMPSIAIFRGVHQLVERVDTASIFGANFKLFHVIGDSRSSSHFLQKRPGLQSQPLQIFLQFHHIRWTDTALLQPLLLWWLSTSFWLWPDTSCTPNRPGCEWPPGRSTGNKTLARTNSNSSTADSDLTQDNERLRQL